jgi:hydrogenase nickel incorporation protein HypA/HybF
MHELAITEAVVSGVREHVGDAKVTRVVLEIGRLCAVVPDAIHFAFDLVTEGTTLEGAELEIIDIAAIATCRKCAAVVPMGDSFVAICNACGGMDMDLVNGQELRIKSVEVV